MLLPQIDATARAARDMGMLVVHAPSGTMQAYAEHPARKRVLQAPPVPVPAERPHPDPPHSVDGSDSSDTTGDAPRSPARWTRQHAGVWIDPERDAIGDDGREAARLLSSAWHRDRVAAGVHTNMCVLERSFSIKQLVRWGIPVYLVRDLTDCMYNPARPPYVSHAAGLELAINYVEQFWCPSVTGAELQLCAGR